MTTVLCAMYVLQRPCGVDMIYMMCMTSIKVHRIENYSYRVRTYNMYLACSRGKYLGSGEGGQSERTIFLRFGWVSVNLVSRSPYHFHLYLHPSFSISQGSAWSVWSTGAANMQMSFWFLSLQILMPRLEADLSSQLLAAMYGTAESKDNPPSALSHCGDFIPGTNHCLLRNFNSFTKSCSLKMLKLLIDSLSATNGDVGLPA